MEILRSWARMHLRPSLAASRAPQILNSRLKVDANQDSKVALIASANDRKSLETCVRKEGEESVGFSPDTLQMPGILPEDLCRSVSTHQSNHPVATQVPP